MPNTFTQIYIQVVFAVNGRQSLIIPSFKEELFKFGTRSSRARGLRQESPVYRSGRDDEWDSVRSLLFITNPYHDSVYGESRYSRPGRGDS